RMPAMIAADEEPRPRACGMPLWQRSDRPAGRATPSWSKVVAMVAATRWSHPPGSSPAPSPPTPIDTRPGRTLRGTLAPTASPSPSRRASKPGRRLALVAGAQTVTGSGRSMLPLHRIVDTRRAGVGGGSRGGLGPRAVDDLVHRPLPTAVPIGPRPTAIP